MSFQDFVCHICGSSFKTTSGLRKHRICQHEREKLKFECPDCDERFIDQTHLNAHKIAKHGNESFTCDKCNKKFSRKLNLTRHQRYHCNYITMTMLKCSSSEATFKRQDSLDDHSVAVHSQRQKFTCNACGAEYKYRGSLSKHKARKH